MDTFGPMELTLILAAGCAVWIAVAVIFLVGDQLATRTCHVALKCEVWALKQELRKQRWLAQYRKHRVARRLAGMSAEHRAEVEKLLDARDAAVERLRWEMGEPG